MFGENILCNKVLDDFFKPLMSRNARMIFNILAKWNPRKLTTLDIQEELKKSEIFLNKRELNNWLTALMDSGIVIKLSERGKPTTVQYEGRYTFVFWKLTSKGLILDELIIYLIKNLELINSSNKTDFLNSNWLSHKIMNLIPVSLMIKIIERHENISLSLICEKLIITEEVLLGYLRNQKNENGNSLFQIVKKKNTLKEKLLKFIGLAKPDFQISLTKTGEKYSCDKYQII
jgi:hypothetical protein